MDKKFSPNSIYKTTGVPLEGGLDFVSAPSMVTPGTLTNCLNYEIVDRNGYRRIDGFHKWDNAYTVESDQEYFMQVTETTPGSSAVGEILTCNDKVFGILTEIEATAAPTVFILYYLRLSSDAEPLRGETASTLRASATVWTTSTMPARAARHTVVALDPRVEGGNGPKPISYVDQGSANPDASLNNDGPPITALAFLKDKSYAVIDALRLDVTSSAVLYAGDVIGDNLQAYILLNPESVGGGVYRTDALYLQSRNSALSVTPSFLRAFGPESLTNIRLARLLTSPVSAVAVSSTDATIGILHKARPLEEYLDNFSGEIGNIIGNGNGNGYTSPPFVEITGDGFGAQAVALCTAAGGVDAIIPTSAGNNYTTAPTISISGGSPGTPEGASSIVRSWDWAGWRAINTGWTFGAEGVESASGFLTQVDRQRGPSSQVAAYSVGDTSASPGVTNAVLNALDYEGSNSVGPHNWSPGSGTIWDPALVADTTSGSFNCTFRSSEIFAVARSHSIGFADFSNLTETIPTGSVITGVAFKVTYDTLGIDSLTPPGSADLVSYKARACLFSTTDGAQGPGDRVETRLGDFREVDITPSTSNESNSTFTIGGDNDVWGNLGLTIDQFTANAGVGFDVEVRTNGSPSFAYSFQVDKVELILYYRSPQVTYYFSSGTGSGTSKNVVSATLVSLEKESGELTQGTWKGAWQVADLGVSSYAATGTVGLVTITDGGSGYTSAPVVGFTGGGGGIDFAGTAVIVNGAVVGVVITDAGTGYASAPNITFTGGGGTGAAATATLGSLPGIMDGMGIYLNDPSDATPKRIGFVNSTMTYNGLDSHAALKAVNSRYEIVTANFYADEAWEGLYGVSGAGRAWYFDGNYFSRIYAISLDVEGSATKDIPRHICNYRYHLALGYKAGSVLFSVIGEPQNFAGVDGATEVGIGDRVVGILPLPGQYLAVFCENSIWGITGKTAAEFSLENISPYSGAIEYSIVAIGDKPIYCDTMGISTLRQAQEYGNFLGNRMSYKIAPWLLPRLVNRATGNTSGLVAAFPVRSKNQYRLWFRDGVQLVLTFVGQESEPQFTFTRYLLAGKQLAGQYDEGVVDDNYTDESLVNSTDKVVPLALCSQVDQRGRENVLFSVNREASITRLPSSVANLPNFVYRVDYLNQFDAFYVDSGETIAIRPLAIPAYIQTAFTSVENPFYSKTVRKVRLEGTSRGVSSLVVCTDKNYIDPDLLLDAVVDCPLNKTDTIPWELPQTYRPASYIANVSETDRVLTIKIGHFTKDKKKVLDSFEYLENYVVTKTPTAGEGRVHYCEPAHYIQLMLIQYEEGKQDA